MWAFEIQETFGHLFGQYISTTFRDSETETDPCFIVKIKH